MLKRTLTPTYNAYRLGTCRPLTELQMNRLIGFFSQPPPKTDSVLGGRSSVSYHRIEDLGPVVVKHYKRGGLIGRLIKRRYLKWGKTRGQLEFELLQKVRSLGINVPEPLLYANRGHWFYRAWLVTREIKEPLSLARLSLIDEKRARRAMTSVTEQISRLIDHGIWHVDLHPGNVVIDQKDRVFLLDFDKGQVCQGNKTKLRDRYISRWQRAVGKHGLPKMLSEMMRAGLNESPN
jgi:3-deoxy-D-manno-octulosonic acid kinase